MQPPEHRICVECLTLKPFDSFRGGRNKCRKCGDKERAKWRAANRTKDNATSTKYYRENKDKVLTAHKVKYKRDPDKFRDRELRRKFGISGKYYDSLLAEQSGVCACCGKPEQYTNRGKIKDLAVDHNHLTGVVRALLCQRCNIGLGYLDLDLGVDTLMKAISYGMKHAGKQKSG